MLDIAVYQMVLKKCHARWYNGYMELRKYTVGDAEATLRVFTRAVSITAAHDYDLRQIQAWLAGAGDLEAWHEARASANTCVALLQGKVSGFIDVDNNGYIDMLFVDPARTRLGVAAALLEWVKQQAEEVGATKLSAHASITARPFFEEQGFIAVKERRPVVRGVMFVNYLMELRAGVLSKEQPMEGETKQADYYGRHTEPQ